ncbi:MAG: serine hydrolase [Gemmataceae bacterium]
MSRRDRCVLLVLTLGPAVAFGQGKLDAAAVAAAAKEAMSPFAAPGLAVAVVQGDKASVYGFGVRELGHEAPVTPDTIFALASMTKAFTATAVGLLVDDGKAGWDDPVRRHLDWFRLKDPLADRDVTLRDLLCHRTGLARHDLLWYRASWPIEEAVRRMAQLEPAHPVRSRYDYNNLTFAAAGLAVGKAAGKPWDEFVRERIFTPLGMKNAVFTAAEAKARPDHATPHRRAGNRQAVISWYPDEKQVRASGSIKASGRDLVPWLRMQLDGGVLDGKRIISAASLAETHRPQIVVRLSPAAARLTETTQASYGLGWSLRDYRGWGLVEHGGANDGFRGRIVLVPKAKLGLAILTNCEEGEMVEALGHRLLDEALGLKPKEWVALARKRQSPPRTPPTPKPGTKPSRELAAYAGKYRDEAYGELVIEEKGRGLHLAWSSFRVPLAHFHFDTFQAKAKDEENQRVDQELATFALDEAGDVARVTFLGRTFRRGG